MNSKFSITIQKLVRNPIFLGVLIGFLAAFSQALLISAGGPEAYGFCVACHTRDLINGIFNKLYDEPILGVAPISTNSISPVLSIVGVMIGAFIASKSNKEFKIKRGKWWEYVIYFLGGILVLFFALIIGGCPYRNALRFAYGDLVAFIAILAMTFGVFVGVKILLFRMEKKMVTLSETTDESTNDKEDDEI